MNMNLHESIGLESGGGHSVGNTHMCGYFILDQKSETTATLLMYFLGGIS